MRLCAECSRVLPRSSFTTRQYTRGSGSSRCTSCVDDLYEDIPASPSTSGRYNYSSLSDFTDDSLENPFAEGSFRYVAVGRYNSGAREDQKCVAKWFKTGTVFFEDYFDLDIAAVDKALEIVDRFNELNIVDKPVKINVPTVWTFEGGGEWSGVKHLCEPYIKNYEKFNSNSGWFDDSDSWGEAMQALSHFSYHVTGGRYVLCDLQGGVYRRKVVLSDPVILSRTREYGVTDLGPSGISTFFSEHVCNDYCRSSWRLPSHPARYFRPTSRTTMVRHTVPTRYSRPTRTRAY